MPRERTVITYGAGMTEKTEDREMVWAPITEEDQAFLQAEREEICKDPWSHHTAEFIASARERLAHLRPSALCPPDNVDGFEIFTVPFKQHEIHNDQAWYYWRLIELDRQTKRLIEKGEAAHAAVAALTYGQIYAEMLLKLEQEPTWKTGKKQRQSLTDLRETHNRNLHLERKSEWDRWNAAAAEIWKRHPLWKVQPVAKQVKKDLALADSVETIRRRLKKTGKAS